MKITLSQGILVNERSKEIDEFANIVKTIESDVIPHKGDFISDSLYGEFNIYEYEVTDIVISYTDNCCQVDLEPMIVGSKELVQRYKDEIAPWHGWE